MMETPHDSLDIQTTVPPSPRPLGGTLPEAPPKRGLTSLWGRFALMMVGLLVILVVGGAYMMRELRGLGDTVAEYQIENRKMFFFHQLEYAADVVLSGDVGGDLRSTVGHLIRHDMALIQLMTPREKEMVEIVMGAVGAPDRYRHAVRDVRDDLSKTHDLYDQSLMRSGEQFSARLQRAHASLLVIIAAVLAVVSLPPLIFLGNLISGLTRLREKVELAHVGGEISSIPIKREDELGDVANALDAMHRALKDRQVEQMINRELLAEQNKMSDIANMAGGIAHEVGNPLVSIVAQLDMLEDGYVRAIQDGSAAFNEEVEAGFQGVRESVHRIEGFLRRMAAFPTQRIEEDEAVDVNALVTTILEMVRLDERARQIEFRVQLAAEIPALHTSRARLGLVLFGLVSSAAQEFHDGSGVVRIETEFGSGRHVARIAVLSVGAPSDADLAMESGVDGRETIGDFASLRLARDFVDAVHGRFEFVTSADGGFGYVLELPLDHPPAAPKEDA